MSYFRHIFVPDRPWLFKKIMHDEVFGKMWFNRNTKEPQYDHYQAHLLFKPTQKEVDVFIDADAKGIAQEQRSIFLALERDFTDHMAALANYMNQTRTSSDVSETMDIDSNYVLFGISIARIDDTRKDFALSFAGTSAGSKDFTASFKAGEVLSLS
jgi:hypothetical protein